AHDQREPLANLTRRVIDRVTSSGGTVYPLNPKLDTVFGLPSLASVAELPAPIDVLIVLLGEPAPVIRAAADAKPRFVMVFAGGFAEGGGEEGRLRERDLRDAVESIGARLYGPNTNINALESL